MKILQEKEPFENWKLEVKCTGGNWRQEEKVPCGSSLEMDIDDLLKREWSKYPDERGTDYGFICPICGCFTNINEKHLNEHLKKMAKDYNNIKSVYQKYMT